jgi:acyl-CoA synthetase (NDP forming)
MKHELDPLLRPNSVAIVGASAREGSMGEWSLTNLRRGGFGGNIYPVNPGYDELQSLRCYKSLSDLPETPDLVLFAVSDLRIEQALDEAIKLAVPAAVLMSSLHLDNDKEPLLKDRVRQKLHAAGMLVCGANGMGFYNIRDSVWACGFDSRMHAAPGNASLISHSGSGMCGIIDCEERLRLNFAVSTGNELSVSMDQYLDFVLELPETRVVGLFVETARNPQGFRAALEKAVQKRIPIVALKVGRTRKSAELTVSHSGALAGDDATYDALFERYGVHRVLDMDELATALILFAELNPLGPGGLVTLHDSGGERQLMVDLADAAGVPLTDLGADTVAAIEKVLDPELPAVNPLDAWSRGGETAASQMTNCLTLMMQDDGAALGAIAIDRAPDGFIYPSHVDRMRQASDLSGKPVALVASRQGTGCDPLVVATTHNGFPVVDGVSTFLSGVRGLMNYRDFLRRPAMKSTIADDDAITSWSKRLQDSPLLDEEQSLSLLRDFGISAVRSQIAETGNELTALAQDLGYPLVLKTAKPDVAHKTEQKGVVLDVQDEQQLIDSYADIESRLGSRVILAKMAPAGVEMFLGARTDPQFGPVVMFGFGGVLAEVIADVIFALPPFDAAYARRRLNELKLHVLLDGVRGSQPCNIDAFSIMAEKFSVMVDALRDDLSEIDVNPVIVGNKECLAVDALIVGRNKGENSEH